MFAYAPGNASSVADAIESVGGKAFLVNADEGTKIVTYNINLDQMHMKDITLLIMAAGMGSRYGGLKQLDSVGPNGETIIDYSVYDAIRAGFNKVVFIIRREFEKEFKSQITNKYEGSIQVEFAFQELNNLPDGFECPPDRQKPWGTGHAILSAADLIQEPFVVINGDDFYGLESYQIVSDYYKNGGDMFTMVAYELGNTLSEFGGVTRGLCTLEMIC